MPVAETTEEQVTHAATLVNQPYIQMLSALSGGRALDGWQLFQQLQTQKASNFLPQADSAVDQLGEDFKKWVTDTFPALARNAPSGWNASRLEYHFDCAAPNGSAPPTILRVAEHDGSFLDWHTFEQGSDGSTPVHPELGPSRFRMPLRFVARRRYCRVPCPFPARRVTGGGKWKTARLTWQTCVPQRQTRRIWCWRNLRCCSATIGFLFHSTCRPAVLIRLPALVVTDVFGDVTTVLPTSQSEHWGLFSIAGKTTSGLWLPPVATSVTQSPAKEEVLLLRDEMANLAWGIENLIPDGLGEGRDGLEAATALRQWLEQLLGVLEQSAVRTCYRSLCRQAIRVRDFCAGKLDTVCPGPFRQERANAPASGRPATNSGRPPARSHPAPNAAFARRPGVRRKRSLLI